MSYPNIDYDNINERIELLYDAIYNKKQLNKYYVDELKFNKYVSNCGIYSTQSNDDISFNLFLRF